jgi:hypothetical protein
LYIAPRTYIYRKEWLTNRLSLPIILNLVLELSTVRTLFSLSHLQPTSSLPLLNGLRCCCCLLPPPNQRCSPIDQPFRSCCHWFLLPLATTPTCRAEPWFLLPCLCRPSSHHEDNNSFYCCVVQHSLSGLIEAYDHQLSLLANANEAISSWSRCFPLCQWLSVVSSVSCFWLFWWFFFGNQPLFSPLEATGSAYFKRITLFYLHGRPASYGRLLDIFLCLAHYWEIARFSVEFSHYVTPWVFSRSSTRRCFGYYIHAACQVII